MTRVNGIEVKVVCRWGKNGRKYVWKNPTQKKMNELESTYGIEQITDEGCVWLEW